VWPACVVVVPVPQGAQLYSNEPLLWLSGDIWQIGGIAGSPCYYVSGVCAARTP
jgi:hypothetical protein